MRSNLYKYKLHEMFIKHFGAEAADKKKEFANQINISVKTVRRECNIRINEPQVVEPARLAEYAKLFNCQTTDLRNHVTNQLYIPCQQTNPALPAQC